MLNIHRLIAFVSSLYSSVLPLKYNPSATETSKTSIPFFQYPLASLDKYMWDARK